MLRSTFYKSSLIIKTREEPVPRGCIRGGNLEYNHEIILKDKDNYFEKLNILNQDELNELTEQIKKDHIDYLNSIKGRKKAITKITIETKVR